MRLKGKRKAWLRQERNYMLYVRRGMDYYQAGISSLGANIKHTQAGLVIQRLKHVTKGLHWFTSHVYSTPTHSRGYWGFKYVGDLPF